jgi:hypothetical protein
MSLAVKRIVQNRGTIGHHRIFSGPLRRSTEGDRAALSLRSVDELLEADALEDAPDDACRTA